MGKEGAFSPFLGSKMTPTCWGECPINSVKPRSPQTLQGQSELEVKSPSSRNLALFIYHADIFFLCIRIMYKQSSSLQSLLSYFWFSSFIFLVIMLLDFHHEPLSLLMQKVLSKKLTFKLVFIRQKTVRSWLLLVEVWRWKDNCSWLVQGILHSFLKGLSLVLLSRALVFQSTFSN